MNKKYIKPKTTTILWKNDAILTTASPGVNGDYDPTAPIGAKSQDFFDDLDDDDDEIGNVSFWNE